MSNDLIDIRPSAEVNETFFSIQGEGMFTGVPTYFVRFYGCNLDCSWCDQPDALATRHRPKHHTLEPFEVADVVSAHPPEVHLCFTGGEPTFQHQQLMDVLAEVRALDTERHKKRRMVTMETNGTIFLKEYAEEPSTFASISPKPTNVITNGRYDMHGAGDIKRWVESGIRMQFKFVTEDLKNMTAILKWLEYAIPPEARERIPLYFQPQWFERKKFAEVLTHYQQPDNIRALYDLGFREVRFTTQQHKTLAIR